jgi:prepilin-type N-terminal cleavage/methylation domain-containing protein
MIKKCHGFTLVELIISVLIFSFMMASMATVYSTANRYMFQNYRGNVIKSSAGLSMKAIQSTLSTATRIDLPAYGNTGTVLAYAANVDQTTGCYPITTVAPAAWYYFCVAADPQDATVQDLYYHTGTIAGGTGCAAAAPTIWTLSYPPFCGCSGAGCGSSVMILMKNVTGVPFSRSGVTSPDLVHVTLHSLWQASARGFGQLGAQRDVDFTLDTVVKASVPAQ